MSIIFYNIHMCVLFTKLLFTLFSVCVVCMDVHVHLCVYVWVSVHMYRLEGDTGYLGSLFIAF